MTIRKLPSGTHGARTPPGAMGRVVTPLMVRVHRLTGNRLGGLDLLYLTTVGARSGRTRITPLARFDDGGGSWLVVASAGGTATHPAWYHNIAAHPDDVVAEVDGIRHRVKVEQLENEDRDTTWRQIIERAPRFHGYEQKTDRQLPVLRLTPVS
jgi:deazaflavin-dependent oxidoreductase (nitroreductase family)